MADEKENEQSQEVFRKIPQRRLTDTEKVFIELKVEKSKLNRERAMLILDKGLLLFFGFLLLGVIGFLNKLINQMTLNVLIVAGLCVLLISVIPYSSIAKKSEKELEDIIDSLLKP